MEPREGKLCLKSSFRNKSTAMDISIIARMLPGILFVLLLLLSISLLAQGGPTGVDGDPDQIPVDGGIGWLLAAGAAYGVKKYRARKQQRHPHHE